MPLSYCLSSLLWNALIVIPWILGGFRAPVWVSLLLVVLLIAMIMSVRWDIQGEARRQAAARTLDKDWQTRPFILFAAAAAVADLPSSCTVTRRLEWSAYRFRTALTFIAVAAWLDLFWPKHRQMGTRVPRLGDRAETATEPYRRHLTLSSRRKCGLVEIVTGMDE